jgi:hypothetical protein
MTERVNRPARWVFSPDCSAHLLLVEDDVLSEELLLPLAAPDSGQSTSWTCPDCRAIFLLDSTALGSAALDSVTGELARQDE